MSGPGPGSPVEVKICGVTRRADAVSAEELGASYVGVVMTGGFGRSVEVTRATEIVEGLEIDRVAVLVDESPERAAELAGAIGASVVQLHGSESPEAVRAVRALGPWRVWKAVRAAREPDLERAVVEYGGVADAMLVEGWKEGVVGGGGARLSLDGAFVRARIRPPSRLVLAGGLRPESVADAVRAFRPDIVDVSSGVERRRGEKDVDLVRAFIEAVRSAGGDREQPAVGA